MGIIYSNVLFLHVVWTMHGLKECSVCPDEIAEGEPSTSINDNDDFVNDTLTEGGSAYCCNWMFLQCLERQCQSIEVQELEVNTPVCSKDMSRTLIKKV